MNKYSKQKLNERNKKITITQHALFFDSESRTLDAVSFKCNQHSFSFLFVCDISE